jgi:hypothetical protein
MSENERTFENWRPILNTDEFKRLMMEMLSEKLPGIDLETVDHKMLMIAQQDFINCLKVSGGFVGDEDCEVKTIEKLEALMSENFEEFKSSLDAWIGMWVGKWKNRTKLLINKKQDRPPIPEHVECAWRNLPNRYRIVELVVEALVKHGEICGTMILAECLVKKELGKSKELAIKTSQDELDFAMRVVAEARALAYTIGPLIFIKVEKTYYEETFWR